MKINLSTRRGSRYVAAAAVLAAVSATVGAAPASSVPAPAGAAAVAELTRTVTYGGRTVTARLHPVALRAPGFEVLVQQADGSFVKQSVGAERAWLGSVDGDPAARASGIVRSDGAFEGSIVFDRGATWRIRDTTVTSTRGLTPPAAYKWPSATDAGRNVSLAPGQVGTTTYRFDVGFDLSHAWFTHAASINGSVAKALDAVELTAVSMLGLYESNALLRTAVGRVVIRGDAAKDPYAAGAELGKVKTEWTTNQADASVDNVVLQHDPAGGGGLAWVGTAGTSSADSLNAGAGANPIVIRHEVGHNWGAHDNHTNGPEGATVESGNAYDRFDGTELSAIMRYRDTRQKATAPFTAETGAFAEPLPPYAALDLADDLDSGVPFSLRPTANDHDANGGALTLTSAQATSRLGGVVTRTGDVLTYTPPTVAAAQTVDSVDYVVTDASGRTATGVVLFRVDPYVAPPAPSTWPAQQHAAGTAYELRNRQSGLYAAAPAGATGTATLVQRDRGDRSAQFTVAASGSGVAVRNLHSGLCADVNGGSTADGATVLQYACHGGTNQQWTIAEHPKGGSALINVRSGKCLATRGASVLTGAELVQATCGLSLSQVWDVALPPFSTWEPVTPVTTSPNEIVSVPSGLHAGVPAGTTGNADVVQRAAGTGTSFTLISLADGSYELKERSTGRCVDDHGGTASYVGTWSCHSGSNQRWLLRAHPSGGTAVIGQASGKCLAPEGASTAAGVRLLQVACGASAVQGWRFESAAPETSYFENTADVAIPDNNGTGITSPVTVVRSGSAPATLKVAVDIVHPYVGDLVVDLVAPDGSVYNLRNRSGGSADDIVTTYTVDASSETAAGTWRLRVRDVAAYDVGRINAWSLQF